MCHAHKTYNVMEVSKRSVFWLSDKLSFSFPQNSISFLGVAGGYCFLMRPLVNLDLGMCLVFLYLDLASDLSLSWQRVRKYVNCVNE